MMQQSERQPFAVMAKPVGSLCNMRCSYCYYLDKGTGGAPMDDAMLELLIKRYIEAHPGPIVPFTWHGGEPTLAGISFYQKAVALQRQYLKPGMRCWNNLQTNGLWLDDDWCVFLKENGFDVGLSIDGCREAHDVNRRDAKGDMTYDTVAQNIVRLKAYGIRPDLLCAVSAQAAAQPQAVYRALRNLDTGWVQFIPIVVPDGAGGVTAESVTAQAYGQFLVEIFDDWLASDLGRLDVQLFAETALVLTGGEASLCWMAPTCGRVLVVERDGSVYACDHFVDPAHCLGNLKYGRLDDLLALPQQVQFGLEKRDALPGRCRRCEWLPLCNGACPKDRFLSDEGGQPVNYLCEAYRRFFAHAVPSLRLLMELRQSGKSLATIQEIFRERHRTIWKGIGRNDPCPCGSGKKAKHCCGLRKTHLL